MLARGRSAAEGGSWATLPLGRVSTCRAEVAGLRRRAEWEEEEEEVGELRGGLERAVGYGGGGTDGDEG